MDISVVILNYNTRQLTLDCLNSVNHSIGDLKIEIFVVDNASIDGSVEAIRKKFPHVQVIANKINVGFSKANNQAIKLAKGKYILLLNSDTIVNGETFSQTFEYMNHHPKVGAIGCKLILPDGRLDPACHRGFPTPQASFYYMTGMDKRYPNKPKFNGYHLGHLNMNEIHEIDCLVGAFMLVRSETIQQVGLLDENFFFYGEDIDWCYRIKMAGWKIIYYPHVSIIHYKGASSRRKPLKIVFEFYRAMYLFHRKHFTKKYPLWMNGLVYTGIFLKGIVAILKNEVKRLIKRGA